jgi:flagellin-like protein
MRQKGVSPLIATVMLVVIVVSLVALLSGWLTNMFVESRESVSNRTATSMSCSGASHVVRSVYINPAGAFNASARVTVENDGLVDGLSIISAELYNSTGYNFATNTTLPINPFARGSIATFIFENVSMSGCNGFSQIVVTTQCGSYTYNERPNNC